MRQFGSRLVLAALAALLASCSGFGADVSSYVADPTAYEFYSCPQIAQALEAATKRIRELERVMATSTKSAGGNMINATSYKPDYIKQRGNMDVLLQTARQKHCDLAASRSNLNR
jgi:hypothetical protein